MPLRSGIMGLRPVRGIHFSGRIGVSGAPTPTPTPTPVTLLPLTLSADMLAEGSPQGTAVGTLSGKTSGSTLSLFDNAGGRFQLTGTTIQAGPTATDYETATSHNVTVRETRAGATNSPRDTVLPIGVSNVAEVTLAPLTGSFTLAENAPAGAVAGSIDGKSAGSTLSLIDNAGGRVALSGANIVRGATALNYETATSHSFTVRETHADAGNSPRDTVLSLAVTNVAEQPALAALSLSPASVPEDAAATIAIVGATAGSVLTVQSGALPAGMVLNSAARTITGTPADPVTASFTLRETLADSSNSPRDTVLSIYVTDVVESSSPIISIASGGGYAGSTYAVTEGGTGSWQVDVAENGTWANISGATSSTYVQTYANEGKPLRWRRDDGAVSNVEHLWMPTDIPADHGLQRWFDGIDPAARLLVDNKVSSLADKMNAGANATQSDAAKRPVVAPDGRLDFTGMNINLAFPALGSGLQQTWALLFMEIDWGGIGSSDGALVYVGGTSATTRSPMLGYSRSNSEMRAQWSSGGSIVSIGIPSLASNVPYALLTRIGSDSYSRVNLNGEPEVVGSVIVTPGQPRASGQIGDYRTSLTTWRFGGLLVGIGTLSDASKTLLEGWAKHRHGIPLPAGHAHFASAPRIPT